MDKIFISIISCREKFLEQTILSALKNAYYPNNVYVGIFNTVLDNNPIKLTHLNVNINNFFSKKILGIGLSRKKAIEMCPKGIDYILQVDAHMVFEKNWDIDLIKSINELEINFKKVIISQQLGSWQPIDDNNVFLHDNRITDPYNVEIGKGINNVKIKYKNYQDGDINHYPQTWGYIEPWDDKYAEMISVSGPFVFARKSFFDEIVHDERCYWGADEGIFAMRAWTRGYKIFATKKHLAYHLDKGILGWDYDWRNNLKDVEWEWNNTYRIIKNILTGYEIGEFGAPSKTLLKDYQEFANYDFKKYYEKLENLNKI